MDIIEEFRGKFYFLSNFYEQQLTFDGITYRNAEAAFQAQKTLAVGQRLRFANLLPGEAKRLGRRVTLRADWDDVRLDVMRAVVRTKFENTELSAMLLATGDARLVEGNTWGDKFWGTCEGIGFNHLGSILEDTRAELRQVDVPEVDVVEDDVPEVVPANVDKPQVDKPQVDEPPVDGQPESRRKNKGKR